MRTGILLMAHGTPASLDEMPEYLRLVRGGRPPSPELVAEMRHNYAAIGGRSPLTDITLAQAAALAARLGPAMPVAVGMRNWRPFITDAVAELAGAGRRRASSASRSRRSSRRSACRSTSTPRGARCRPGSASSRCGRSTRIRCSCRRSPSGCARPRPQPDEEIVFTAHSLPVRVIEGGDGYANEVAATAGGVARARGHRAVPARVPERRPHAGAVDGPRRSTSSSASAPRAASRRFLVVPIGFVCDHTEILFDIDVQAAAAARECGVALRRTASLNTSPTFIAMLEDLVEEAADDPRSSAAGSRGWRRRTSCTGRDVPFVLVERGPRAGGVILSEQVDGFTIDAGPDALLIQKPDGIQLCRGARARRPARRDQAAAARVHPARRPPVPAAGRLGARHPDAHRARSSARACSRGRASCAWAWRCSSRRAQDDGGRVDRRVHDAPLRQRGAQAYLAEPLLAGIHAGDVDRLSVQALFPRFADAERKHGSLLRAFRRQSAPPPARAASRDRGRRVQVAARRPERDGRARSSPCCRPTRSALNDRRRAAVAAGARTAATAWSSQSGDAIDARRRRSSRRRRTSTGAIVRELDAELARALRRGAVRVERDGRARVPPRRCPPSAERLGLRRAARGRQRHPRGVVAVVEMARPRARRITCCCGRSSAARAIRGRSSKSDAELVALSLARDPADSRHRGRRRC